MFEWLKNEMAKVNTQKFYIVDGPAPADLREAMRHSALTFHPLMKNSRSQFGNAKLYHRVAYTWCRCSQAL